MNCYFCDTNLNSVNKSAEHIIPDFLGGRLTSDKLLCKKSNSDLGSTVDAELANQLKPFADILIQSPKKEIKVKLQAKSGEELYVGEKLKPYSQLTIKLREEDKTIHVTDDKALDKLIKKKEQETQKK